MEQQSGIYCIKNIATEKRYVGQSRNIAYRWSKHVYDLNHNKHDNDYLQKAWNKYGKESFAFEVLEYCSVDDLDEREIYYIDLYHTLDRDYGYNLRSGGQNEGTHLSDYSRHKLSQSVASSYTDELRERRRRAALRQWSNPEIKAKISGTNSAQYVRILSEDTRRRIGEAQRGRISDRRNLTPVKCIELNQVFQDATTASKTLNVDSGGILKVCRGERKKCGNYHWEFILGE